MFDFNGTEKQQDELANKVLGLFKAENTPPPIAAVTLARILTSMLFMISTDATNPPFPTAHGRGNFDHQ